MPMSKKDCGNCMSVAIGNKNGAYFHIAMTYNNGDPKWLNVCDDCEKHTSIILCSRCEKEIDCRANMDYASGWGWVGDGGVAPFTLCGDCAKAVNLEEKYGKLLED